MKRNAREAVLRQLLNPEAAQPNSEAAQTTAPDEPPPPSQVVFDPALFEDPSVPDSFEQFRVEGLRRHLWRYSGQQSCRNIVARLEDSAWLAAWDSALCAVKGARVVFRGSELGVFGLRAAHHGATHVRCVESFPLNGRITSGMVQKHLLGPWHALHGTAIQQWSEEERRRSFEAFAKDIDIVAPEEHAVRDAVADYWVFPNIDHSLLGTGIVKALRQEGANGSPIPKHLLPARATVYAMGIQWTYPQLELQPVNRLRWSPYPQSLEIGPELWTALTAPIEVGEIDFASFAETTWNVALPAVAGGAVDAILFWFELDLGNTRLSNAPESDLRCIKPAVQYIDPLGVAPGHSLPLRIHVGENRLHFQTQPPVSQTRSHGLPSWYVPMLGDQQRNDAYRTALDKALSSNPARLVLDIGAGCGLLSMLAAAAGAQRVIGCETHPAICAVGNEVIGLNGYANRITLVNKDCRALKTPADLPRRADLAVFELFDCSLIGEGVLHFLAHAREHLLSKDACYVPAGARLRAKVIEYRLDRIWDSDANLLNPYRFSPSFINVDARMLAHRALTEPFDLFTFDFAEAEPTPQTRELRIVSTSPGTAGAVLFWFDLQMDETTWISNDPHNPSSLHWKQGLQFLPEVRVSGGMELPLIAKHDGSGLKFHWQPDVLPREAFSLLPRFDPRWLAVTQDLEQQTRGLMQHCAANPEEYRKVAELAQRFAIEPAAHDLEPLVAQRFVAMFP